MRGYLENSVEILQQKINAADELIAIAVAPWGYHVINGSVGVTQKSVDVFVSADGTGRGYSASLRECHGTDRWLDLVVNVESAVGLIEIELPEEVWNPVE